MGVTHYRRSSVVFNAARNGKTVTFRGNTVGSYMRWNPVLNKLEFVGASTDLGLGSFGTPIVVDQDNNYPFGVFGEVSVANSSGTTVERAMWARLKVSKAQTGAFSIFGGELQFRWSNGCGTLGSGVENAQYGGAWLYLEQDTAGQALADYAHASGAVIQVETYKNLTIPTNAHLSGLQVESRLGAATPAGSLTNVSGIISGIFITKSPAASGVTAQDWPVGIYIEDVSADGIKIAGAPTDGIEISGACTNCINITSVGSAFGLLYNVDMPTQIGSHVEGIKVILERTADVVIGTSNILGAEFIIKQGSDSYAAGMAPQITGVRIAMGGANTKATVYGLKCETQSSGFVNYLGMFSVNAGCTLGSGGAVVTVRSYVAADNLLKIEQIGATTAVRGLLICDNVGTGTITHVIEIDARSADALFKFSSGNGALVSITPQAMTKDPESDAEDGYITVVVGSNTYQVPMYTA